MGINKPNEIVEMATEAGISKAKLPLNKTLILGFLAGVYIAMGGLLSVLIGFGFPEITANNPGLQRLLSGAMFPLGLILVVLAGAELFTGNNAVLIPSMLSKKIGIGAVLKNWFWVYVSNFAGALFFAYIMVYISGIFDAEPWHTAICKIANGKIELPWLTVFIRGIGANWLVCLAVWLGMSSRSMAGKMLGLWFPVMCFVAIGYEHSIANMFFIPEAMMQGADITISQLFIDNLLPATLGNIVGGALFVGTFYWYAYAKDSARKLS